MESGCGWLEKCLFFYTVEKLLNKELEDILGTVTWKQCGMELYAILLPPPPHTHTHTHMHTQCGHASYAPRPHLKTRFPRTLTTLSTHSTHYTSTAISGTVCALKRHSKRVHDSYSVVCLCFETLLTTVLGLCHTTVYIEKCVFESDFVICVQCSLLLTCLISCRDHAADVLFEDEGEDSPIPACILNALMKVSL